MPGSYPQTLKDVIRGITTFKSLQVIRTDRKVWIHRLEGERPLAREVR